MIYVVYTIVLANLVLTITLLGHVSELAQLMGSTP
jgi:hypothetical protein